LTPFFLPQILAVNGTPVTNLMHLAQLVTSCKDDYLCFDCDYNETIVINRQQAATGTQAVLQDHSIPAAMSQDIQQTLGCAWPPPLQEAEGKQGSSQQQAAAAASQAVPVAAAAAAAVGGSSSSTGDRS
jgi:hypothetical protein